MRRARNERVLAALAALLAWSHGRDSGLRALEVRPGTLQDVFVKLTGRVLRD